MEYGHYFIINPSLGMSKKGHPSRPISSSSVRINPSLLMMNESHILSVISCSCAFDLHGHLLRAYLLRSVIRLFKLGRLET